MPSVSMTTGQPFQQPIIIAQQGVKLLPPQQQQLQPQASVQQTATQPSQQAAQADRKLAWTGQLQWQETVIFVLIFILYFMFISFILISVIFLLALLFLFLSLFLSLLLLLLLAPPPL